MNPPSAMSDLEPGREASLPDRAPVALNGTNGALQHHFTVDVEEYFQVAAFEGTVPRAFWSRFESRVEASVDRLLEQMAASNALGTFFILGWVAERRPGLVGRISRAGHEVASHGWDHRRVPAQTPEEFRRSIRRTKGVLEGITGTEVLGFRAPSFSLVPGHEWALDILIEEGYRYDSSLFPIRRPGYGYPDGERGPHGIARPSGRILEFPPATLRRCGVNLPAAGGAYLRFLPYGFIRRAVRELAASGQAATLYVHPWELDPGQPRFDVSPLTRLRHYGGLGRTGSLLERLLGEFRFRTIASALDGT